jgi:hypothetical protein
MKLLELSGVNDVEFEFNLMALTKFKILNRTGDGEKFKQDEEISINAEFTSK